MTKFINIFGIALSLMTATGVFIHDGRIDKAAFMNGERVYKRNAVASTIDAGAMSEAHTHPEKTQRTLKGFSYISPSIQPRENKSKRYLMQNTEPRGRHAFDNYNLPIIA